MNRLIPKSHFCKNVKHAADSVKRRLAEQNGDEKHNARLLYRAERAWASLERFRQRRLRNLRYVFGDQWGDLVSDGNGNVTTERERINKRTGGIALQNNHLIKIVNTLVGLYAKTSTSPVCFARQRDADQKSQMMTNALQCNWENNEMKELLVDNYYEFICSGIAIAVEEWCAHNGVEDSYTFKVAPSHFFVETKGEDPRHWDISLIGEIRDYTLGELASALAKSEYDYKQLEQIYAPYTHRRLNTSHEPDLEHDESFYRTHPSHPCRTYHIWTLETKPRYRCTDLMDFSDPLYRIEEDELPLVKAENAARQALALAQGMAAEEVPLIEYEYIVDTYWHFQMLTPDGRVLEEYDSPFEHASHPYTFKAHHYVNGDIVPFISVVIDQQRYINRLITLHDMAINASFKGLKMVPVDCIPDGMTRKEFAEQSIEIGGTLFYQPSKSGEVPSIITSNSTNIGTSELLTIELNSINDITSVSESLQGKSAGNSVAASRYAMETENSTTSIAALIHKFTAFEMDVARKKMKTIHQYYSEPRNIAVKHSSGYSEMDVYEPKEVQDIDFSIAVKESAESPVARMQLNDLVKELWQAGQINAEQLLSYGYYPGSEMLLQSLRASNEAMQQGQPQGIPQDQIAAATQGADPAAIAQMQAALQQGG